MEEMHTMAVVPRDPRPPTTPARNAFSSDVQDMLLEARRLQERRASQEDAKQRQVEQEEMNTRQAQPPIQEITDSDSTGHEVVVRAAKSEGPQEVQRQTTAEENNADEEERVEGSKSQRRMCSAATPRWSQRDASDADEPPPVFSVGRRRRRDGRNLRSDRDTDNDNDDDDLSRRGQTPDPFDPSGRDGPAPAILAEPKFQRVSRHPTPNPEGSQTPQDNCSQSSPFHQPLNRSNNPGPPLALRSRSGDASDETLQRLAELARTRSHERERAASAKAAKAEKARAASRSSQRHRSHSNSSNSNGNSNRNSGNTTVNQRRSSVPQSSSDSAPAQHRESSQESTTQYYMPSIASDSKSSVAVRHSVTSQAQVASDVALARKAAYLLEEAFANSQLDCFHHFSYMSSEQRLELFHIYDVYANALKSVPEGHLENELLVDPGIAAVLVESRQCEGFTQLPPVSRENFLKETQQPRRHSPTVPPPRLSRGHAAPPPLLPSNSAGTPPSATRTAAVRAEKTSAVQQKPPADVRWSSSTGVVIRDASSSTVLPPQPSQNDTPPRAAVATGVREDSRSTDYRRQIMTTDATERPRSTHDAQATRPTAPKKNRRNHDRNLHSFVFCAPVARNGVAEKGTRTKSRSPAASKRVPTVTPLTATQVVPPLVPVPMLTPPRPPPPPTVARRTQEHRKTHRTPPESNLDGYAEAARYTETARQRHEEAKKTKENEVRARAAISTAAGRVSTANPSSDLAPLTLPSITQCTPASAIQLLPSPSASSQRGTRNTTSAAVPAHDASQNPGTPTASPARGRLQRRFAFSFQPKTKDTVQTTLQRRTQSRSSTLQRTVTGVSQQPYMFGNIFTDNFDSDMSGDETSEGSSRSGAFYCNWDTEEREMQAMASAFQPPRSPRMASAAYPPSRTSPPTHIGNPNVFAELFGTSFEFSDVGSLSSQLECLINHDNLSEGNSNSLGTSSAEVEHPFYMM